MRFNYLFKLLSILSLILFYIILLTGIITILADASYAWWPDSSFAKSFGEFAPLYAYMTLDFYQQPEIYADQSFRFLSLFSDAALFLFVLLMLWLLYKFLKYIYKDSLFMYENVSILFWMGITFAVLGSATTYIDGLLVSKAITDLEISNASIAFSNIAYADFIFAGIVMVIFASALKKAVHAVEENKKTI